MLRTGDFDFLGQDRKRSEFEMQENSAVAADGDGKFGGGSYARGCRTSAGIGIGI
jgi:hypothetical protein